MANNRFYISCEFHHSSFMFAKDWGEYVSVYVEKEDFVDRPQSFEEWLTEHRFCSLKLTTELDTIGKEGGRARDIGDEILDSIPY